MSTLTTSIWLSLILLLCLETYAQSPKYFIRHHNAVTIPVSNRNNGGGGGFGFYALQGNYLIPGAHFNSGEHSASRHIYLISPYGDLIKEYHYNQYDGFYLTNLQNTTQLENGHLISVGDFLNEETKINWALFTKIDTAGNILLEKTIGITDDAHFVETDAICPTPHQDLLIVGGIVNEQTDYLKKPYLIKVNTEGETLLDTIYRHYPEWGQFLDIKPAPMGGYYAVGFYNYVPNQNRSTLLLVHIDEQGNIINDYNYDISLDNFGAQLLVESDGTILITGSIVQQLANGRETEMAMVLKLNPDKSLAWITEQLAWRSHIEVLTKTSDGHIVLTGSHDPLDTPHNIHAHMTKINAQTGQVQWQRFIERPPHNDHYINAIIHTPDEGFLMCGRLVGVKNAGESNQEIFDGLYLLKTNCMGLLTTPQTHFTIAPHTPAHTFQFNNHSQFVYPDSIDGGFYHWDFGDGTTSLEQHPEHQYTTAGKYTVQLTAIVCTDTSITTQEIHIKKQGTIITAADSTYFSLPQPHPVTLYSQLPYHLESTVDQALLQVYNIAGQQLHTYTLTDQDGQITLSHQDFPSGVYFFRLLVSGEIRQEEKVVFLK